MTQMMLEVEAECQPLLEAFLQLLSTVRLQRKAAPEGQAVDYAEVEKQLGEQAAALERAAHQAVLSALEVDAAQVQIDGQPYRRVMHSVGSYYTLAGPVSLSRALYRRVGRRTSPTVDAISLRTGAVGDGWLPKTAVAMAWECQRAPAREAEAANSAWQRLPYSRCAFERVAHLVGAHYQAVRHSVERRLVETMPIPDEAHAVSVSLDRVSVPMEEPRAPSAAEAGKRNPKRPVQRVYRMAYAATVTVHDDKGQALHTLRYGRMPQGDIEELCTALGDDVMTLVRRCPSLLVVLLCDGAKELWNRLGAEFTESSLGRPVHRLVDLWHLLEKLGSAARLLYGETEGSAKLKTWRLSLLNDKDAADRILGILAESGKESVRVGDSRPVHEAITYLRNHMADLNYQQARSLGLPVGSGNVEATCKSLFEVRLKRPGCRWKEETGAHIVDLRALSLSDRFAQALRLTLAPLRKPVQLNCAG